MHRRRTVRWGRRTAFLGSLVLLCWLASCYASTEVQISIETDLPCDVVRSRRVAVYVAASPDALRMATPVATSNDCTAAPSGQLAHVGTLTLVPSGDRDGRTAS